MVERPSNVRYKLFTINGQEKIIEGDLVDYKGSPAVVYKAEWHHLGKGTLVVETDLNTWFEDREGIRNWLIREAIAGHQLRLKAIERL